MLSLKRPQPPPQTVVSKSPTDNKGTLLVYIVDAADFKYLIRWVIVTYILLDISVVNSHATSAYDCEFFAVTWHYLLSVRLGNARSVIRP